MRISDGSSDVCSSDLRRQTLDAGELPHGDNSLVKAEDDNTVCGAAKPSNLAQAGPGGKWVIPSPLPVDTLQHGLIPMRYDRNHKAGVLIEAAYRPCISPQYRYRLR